MIKNLFYVITGMYISQEYSLVMPNIKKHVNYATLMILDDGHKNNDLLHNCPILKFIFKK